jgi:phosphomannomutase
MAWDLRFGTGGIRGLMGDGPNRINRETICTLTQGLANYINRQPGPHSSFIGFDTRHHSHTFAHEAAQILVANGIKVYLCKDPRPTPLTAFGCRLKQCTAAIMITASHNPPEYNGYKIYWSDGGQVMPNHSSAILKEVEKVTEVKRVSNSMITIVSEEIDDAYISAGCKLQNYPEDNKRYGKDLKITYTSFHGTGMALAPRMLSGWGFSNIAYVDEQIIPNGDFPTVNYPNPEDKQALTMGLERLLATNSDLLIANDPDADRVGVAVRHHGKAIVLTGNQVACLCLEHLCRANSIHPKAACIKTLVTTELFQAICGHYEVDCFNVPIGFKYMAAMISEWEKKPSGPRFLFGAEDSCGYLYGTLTRDKDGIIPAALIAEMTLQAKRQGKTLIDRLQELHQKYGVYIEETMAIHFEKEMMAQKMADFRAHLPTQFNGIAVKACEEHVDALLFWLADGSKLVVRPSGTEPKIKFYCGVVNSSREKAIQLLMSLKSYF